MFVLASDFGVSVTEEFEADDDAGVCVAGGDVFVAAAGGGGGGTFSSVPLVVELVDAVEASTVGEVIFVNRTFGGAGGAGGIVVAVGGVVVGLLSSWWNDCCCVAPAPAARASTKGLERY